ncbi:MAG: histidinol-phosphate transaminase [Gammaproteobacteria bacterium]
MTLSRRDFLTRTSLSAAAMPTLLTAGVAVAANAAPSAAAAGDYDLRMGFPADAIRMGFNENPLGPSPKAIEGAIAGSRNANRYALGGFLRPFLAKHHGIDPEWVLPGNGSTEVLTNTPIAFMRGGGNVVTPLETWDGMISIADAMGVTVKRVALLKDQGYIYDVPGLLGAIDNDTRLAMVISPNNPTGTTMGYDDLKKIADALPKKGILVCDHAYQDYAGDGKTGLDLLKEGYKNVLVTRTFSKAHALAGLRCGYGMAHPDILKAIANFGCGAGSTNMAAFGAVEGSLSDPAHLERSKVFVAKTRAYYNDQVKKLGLEMVAGLSPFVLIRPGDRGVKAVQMELRKRKIFITDGAGWKLPQFMRVSFGTEAQNQRFFSELTSILQATKLTDS